MNYLDLSNNRVKNLGELKFLQNLEKLDLSHNILSSFLPLAEFLPHLSVLKKIDLNGNQICDSQNFFKEMINLGGCKLKYVNGKEISMFQKKFVSNMKNKTKAIN